MTQDQRADALHRLIEARERINRTLRLEDDCEDVPPALLAFVASEAERMADLIEVMSSH